MFVDPSFRVVTLRKEKDRWRSPALSPKQSLRTGDSDITKERINPEDG